MYTQNLQLHVSTATRNGNSREEQTYKFDCKGGKGDTIKIIDTDSGTRGHGISEVKVFGTSYLSKSKILIQFKNINVGVNSQ